MASSSILIVPHDVFRTRMLRTLLSSVADLTESSPDCGACRVQAAAETEALSGLAKDLSVEGKDGPPRLPLLCLRHFRMLISRIADPGLARTLTEQQAEICERISENMRRAGLKMEARRRDMLSREETLAHLQVLMILAGYQGIAGG